MCSHVICQTIKFINYHGGKHPWATILTSIATALTVYFISSQLIELSAMTENHQALIKFVVGVCVGMAFIFVLFAMINESNTVIANCPTIVNYLNTLDVQFDDVVSYIQLCHKGSSVVSQTTEDMFKRRRDDPVLHVTRVPFVGYVTYIDSDFASKVKQTEQLNQIFIACINDTHSKQIGHDEIKSSWFC
jgi:hypothetical protein